MAKECRITVIGGGVGGYPAAIKAARLGAQVTLIERAEMGGTCLNRGCIPTKSFLQSVEVARIVKESSIFGINVGKPEIDFSKIQKRKNHIIQRLRKGIESLVASKQIKRIKGTAEVIDRRNIRVVEKNETIITDKIILAMGSTPSHLPIPGLEESKAWTSDDFLEMDSPPKVAAIIGGGVIGVELAQVLAGLGCKVTILEMLPQLIPGVDSEISTVLEKSLHRFGVRVVKNAQVQSVRENEITYKVEEASQTIQLEKVIVAVGRRPVLKGIESQKLGLQLIEGAIKVNKRMETNIPGIYAVGDVTGGIMLAHVASAEGECAAINAMGGKREMSYKAVPSCIYTNPEIATVGLTEEQAQQKYDIKVGRFPFAACGKALVLGNTSGMVKIVTDTKYHEILGMHIIGPHATDLISEGVLAINLESTAEELAHSIHPHPTLSEAVMEAAMNLTGGAIHIP